MNEWEGKTERADGHVYIQMTVSLLYILLRNNRWIV
jgi:hypothetical protein